MLIPICLVTYPWFNDPRSHERERKRTDDSSRCRDYRAISPPAAIVKKQPRNVRSIHHHIAPIPHRIVAPHRVAKRASGWSCLSNMATTRPPISLVAYFQLQMTRERRRQSEILGKKDYSRRDSPPLFDRQTYHRGRTMLDESEMYDDRRRLRVRDRASRGASRDYGGVRGGTPERVKHPAA